MEKSKNKRDSTKEKKLALVTGASSGIGYELAKQFAEHGYDLVIAAEDTKIHQCAATLKKIGIEVVPVQVDLAKYQGVEDLYIKAKSLNRPIDAVAVNAGVGVGGDFTRETDLREELNMIELNVVSTVHLTKLVARDMVQRGEGKILLTSSVVSQLPGPDLAIYAASKAFVQSFAQAIRKELEDTGVTVTSLMPGATETNFFHRAKMDDTKVGKGKKDSPADVAKDGFEALMAGKDHVVAGSFMNKVQTTAAKLIPETMKAAIHKKQTERDPSPKHTH